MIGKYKSIFFLCFNIKFLKRYKKKENKNLTKFCDLFINKLLINLGEIDKISQYVYKNCRFDRIIWKLHRNC